MPNNRKQINEVSSIPIVAQEVATMLSSYEPYITSWVTTNGPLLMNLAAGVMAGYYTLGMLADMVLNIGSKQISPEEKTRMIEKRIMSLEQQQKSRYLQENKQMIKEVYNFMKAERLVEGFDRKTILRLIIEALSPEEIRSIMPQGLETPYEGFQKQKSYRKLLAQNHPESKTHRGKEHPPEAQQKMKDLGNLLNFVKMEPEEKKDVLKKHGQGLSKDYDRLLKGFEKQIQKLQQDQGDQKEASPEVKQTVQKLAKSLFDKYSELSSAFSATLSAFKEEPAKFFQSPDFINALLATASKLNEDVTLDPEMSKSLGLEAGKDRENIQKLVAGLEKIRNALIQALSKKGELVKERPEPDQTTGNPNTDSKQLSEETVDPDDDNNVSTLFDWYAENENFDKKARAFIGGQSDDNLEAGFYQLDKPTKVLMKEGDRKEWFRGKKAGVEKELQAGNLNRAAYLLQGEINKWEGEIDKVGKELIKAKFKDKKIVKLFKHQLQVWIDLYKIAGTITDSVEGNKEAGEKGTSKQEAKPTPLVPASIEKFEGNSLTIQGKDGSNPVTVTKEEAKVTYDIITAADKFVRIYMILAQYLYKIAPKEIETIIPNKKILQTNASVPLIEPKEIPLMIGNTPEVKKPDPTLPPEDDKPDEEEEAQEDSDGPIKDSYVNREEFLNWYEDNVVNTINEEKTDQGEQNKKGSFELSDKSLDNSLTDFQDSFLTTPMLQVQSMIYNNLVNNLKLLKNKDFLKNFGLGTGSDTAVGPKDQIDDQISENVDYEQIDIDQESLRTFREQHRNLSRLSRELFELVKNIKNSSELETLGGESIVRDSRNIARQIQESLQSLYNSVSNELASLINENILHEEDQYEAEITSAESRRDRGNKTISVYKKVKAELVRIDKAVRNLEYKKIGQIKVSEILTPAEEAMKELETIRAFYPSFAPFGKNVKNPNKMLKEMKRFVKGLVRDLGDILDQLTGVAPINEAAVKRGKNKNLLTNLKKMIKDSSIEISKYFDVPSSIEGVSSAVPEKVSNMNNAAAEGPAGDKAIKSGKAEDAERTPLEDQKASGEPIVSHSQAITKLASREKVLKDIFKQLSNQPGRMKEIQTIGGKAFTSALVVLLNDFPNAKEQVKEEVGPTINSPEGPGFEVFGLDKEKLIIINKLIKLDKTGGLSTFMYALRKDATGAKYLKRLIDQKLKGISFNLDISQIRKFYMGKEEEEQEVQERLQTKLETIIENYINNRKL